jgi:hypothetical protein
VLKDLRQSLGKNLELRADAQLHHEQFDVMAHWIGDEGQGPWRS